MTIGFVDFRDDANERLENSERKEMREKSIARDVARVTQDDVADRRASIGVVDVASIRSIGDAIGPFVRRVTVSVRIPSALDDGPDVVDGSYSVAR